MSDYEIEIQDEVGGGSEVAKLVRTAAAATLKAEEAASPAALTILLTDDPTLHRLNRDFLGVDAPTDVLSFPAGEGGPADMTPYLGDIAISLARATEQAAAGGHTPEAELQLLTVHGVLHLLGYDHADDREKAAMWAAQAAVLKQLGAEITAPVIDA